MKKSILALAIVAVSLGAFAQTKPVKHTAKADSVKKTAPVKTAKPAEAKKAH